MFVCKSVTCSHVCVQSGVLADMSFIHQAKLVTVVENTHLPGLSFTDQHHGHTIHQTNTHIHLHNLSPHSLQGPGRSPQRGRVPRKYEKLSFGFQQSVRTTKPPLFIPILFQGGGENYKCSIQRLLNHTVISSVVQGYR